MTGAHHADDDRPASSDEPGRSEVPSTDDSADLVAQIRQLAGDDPAEVQRVVAEVLAALERASGKKGRPESPPESGRPPGSD